MLVVNPGDFLFRYLDTDGDGTGTKNAVGNYATATDFYIEAPTAVGSTYVIARMLVHIEDCNGLDTGAYGNGITLTNGITVTVKGEDGNTVLDMTDGVPIITNADWGRQCYDTMLSNYGAGNDYISVRWTFSKAGSPLVLNHRHKLCVTLHDNFSGLVDHYFMVQGYKTTL